MVIDRPKMSIKVLAEYLTNNKQIDAETLNPYKYPNTNGYFPWLYYREAKTIIRRFHDAGNDLAIIHNKLRELERLAAGSEKSEKRRINNNIRIIKDYAGNRENVKLVPRAGKRVKLYVEGVEVFAKPELVASEGTQTILYKFDFVKDSRPEDYAGYIVSSLILWNEEAGFDVNVGNYRYYAITPNQELTDLDIDERFLERLRATCHKIATLWPDV